MNTDLDLYGAMEAPNGRRYRQARDVAEKATRRRIRLLGPRP
jgi:hypothetical protein